MSKNMKQGLVPELRFPEFRGSGEWEPKKLGDKDVSDFVKKRLPLYELSLDTYVSTENILADFGGIKEASKLPPSGSFTAYESGDILIANIRPYLKKVWVANRRGGASNDVVVVRPKNGNAFLSCNLRTETFINYVMQGAKGVKMPRGDIALMKEYPIAIPDTEEQQKIADCLSSLDELIVAHTQKHQELQFYKKGLLQNLFPAEGETVPALRFPEFKNTGDWEVNTLEDVSTFRRGSFPQPYGLPEWYDDENGQPFVQVVDVGDDMRLKPTTKRKISEAACEQSVYIEKGTVIITIQGSIGRVAVTHYDAYIDRTLLLFQSFLKPIDKYFFAYILQILFFIEEQKAPGGIIKTITKETLRSFIVKLPRLEEQQKIANCLSSVDDLIMAQAHKIEELKAHRKGLMQQLFPAMDEVGA